MSAIKEISGRILNDSRNEATVEAHIRFESGALGVASVPAGKSKGVHEAATVEPEKSIALIHNEIAEDLRGKEFGALEEFDNELIALDGTDNKSRIGGNTTTALSVAFARAQASENDFPLYQYFADILGDVPRGSLRLFANMIEGGLHAENNLRFQEHWAVPEAVSFANQVEITKYFFEELGKELRNHFPNEKISFSDEGSYSLNFPSENIPFEIMDELRRRMGLVGSLDFGMDAAASDVKGEPKELEAIYKEWTRLYGLIAIEDPFSQEDFFDFEKFLKEELPNIAIIGDDLTTTNVELMKEAYNKKSINGVIVKPNQIGTLTEALAAVRLAREYGWQVIVSHRSGETLDDWIADFAFGAGADGFKLGAPSKPERLSKYNRLLKIEAEISLSV